MQLVQPGAELSPPTREVIEAISALIRAVRCADHRGGRMLPDTGLRRSDASLLRVLAEHCDPLRTGDIAQRLGVDASVVSRQLATLTAEGLVDRRPDPADARVSLTALTALGRDRLAALYAGYADRLNAALGDLPDDDLMTAAATLRRVAAAIVPAKTLDPNGVR